MTEHDWQTCDDAMRMLRFIGDRVGRRQEALFSAACCARLSDWLTEDGRRLITAFECYAEDENQPDVSGEEFEAAIHSAQAGAPPHIRGAFDALLLAGCGYWRIDADEATEEDACASLAWLAERRAQADLVRDIFGNPHRAARFEPAWRSWRDSTVVRLARSIYDERAFERLPILADALEEAGCTDEDLLVHCRQPAVHVRGCWVLDRVLDR